jgi:hypothetical protein
LPIVVPNASNPRKSLVMQRVTQKTVLNALLRGGHAQEYAEKPGLSGLPNVYLAYFSALIEGIAGEVPGK